MPKNNLSISIVIVHYKVIEVLFDCLSSIIASKPKVSYEIIVVDNDEKKFIKKKLLKKFPRVIYIENPVNNGWGSGTNLGTKKAKGEYLYFLNPDTIVSSGAIDSNYQLAKKHKNAGVVSSLLLDKNKKEYPLQGTQLLTPFNALVIHTFLNTKFPDNPISSAFWYLKTKRQMPYEVEVASLSAALLQRDIFFQLGGFDPGYFLYFEEYDLAQRLKKAGYKSYMNTDSKVIHLWEVSTKFRNDRNTIMEKSRKYYFNKYYGSLLANITDFLITLPLLLKKHM